MRSHAPLQPPSLSFILHQYPHDASHLTPHLGDVRSLGCSSLWSYQRTIQGTEAAVVVPQDFTSLKADHITFLPAQGWYHDHNH